MTYSTEGGLPTRRRKQRRAGIVIGVLLLALLAALGVAMAVNQGWFAKPAEKVAKPKSSCTTAPMAAPSSVTVNVYNATERSGLAKSAAAALTAQGFRLGSTSNDPLAKTIPGSAEVRYGPKGAAAAAAVAARVSGATLLKDDRTDATVDLVLGEKYTAVIKPKASAAKC